MLLVRFEADVGRLVLRKHLCGDIVIKSTPSIQTQGNQFEQFEYRIIPPPNSKHSRGGSAPMHPLSVDIEMRCVKCVA